MNDAPDDRRSLAELRRWLKREKWLHARTDDEHLLPFLQICKYDLKKSKQKITNFYQMRRDRIEWFGNRDPSLPEVQELSKLGVFLPLKKLHENRLVLVIRTAVHDPKKHLIDNVFKTGMMIIDLACKHHQVVEIAVIFDMKNIGFSYFRPFTPWYAARLVFALENYCVRPKRLEFVNAPGYFNVFLRLFTRLMSEKMRNRVTVHYGGAEVLAKVIPKEMLPPEYGGDGDSVEDLVDYWHEKMSHSRRWFEEDERFKAERRDSRK
ncbi:retinol-binding protein pinta-like [Cylas formicarius]|uniref:retinol-binding protein pinta-like n=1 Tax=Cylas formicarius TaxID=197179 RepID=UPI002958D858|nr:retinol-binding protein pinta-like [Cylas formicarius]